MNIESRPTFAQKAGRTALRVVPAGLGAVLLGAFAPSELAQPVKDQPEASRQGITLIVPDALAVNCKGLFAGNAKNFIDLNENRTKDPSEPEADKIGGATAKLQPKGGKEVNVIADQSGHFEGLLEGECNSDGIIPVHAYVKAPGNDPRFVESDDELKNNKKTTYNYWLAQSPVPTPVIAITKTPSGIMVTSTPTVVPTSAEKTPTPMPASTSIPGPLATATPTPTATPESGPGFGGGKLPDLPWLPLSILAAGGLIGGAILSRRNHNNGANAHYRERWYQFWLPVERGAIQFDQRHTIHGIGEVHWDLEDDPLDDIRLRRRPYPPTGGNP